MKTYNKFIKKNKSTPAIFAVDFETLTYKSQYYKDNQYSQVYAVATKRLNLSYNWSAKHWEYNDKDRRELTRTKKPQVFISISDWLEFMRNYRNNNTINYFHNFIKFDRHYLNSYLIDNNIIPLNSSVFNDIVDKKTEIDEYKDFWTFDYAENKYALIKIALWNEAEKVYKVLEVRDSILLFPNISVEQMGKELETLKLSNPNIKVYSKVMDFDPHKVQEPYKNLWDLQQDKIIYNRVVYDVLILAEYISFYISNFSFQPEGTKIYHTVASLCLQNWISLIPPLYPKEMYRMKRFLELNNEEAINKVNDIFIYDNNYYYGGVVSFNPDHKEKLLNNIYSYDINSMYPSQMIKLLPYGAPIYRKRIKEDEKHQFFIFCEITGSYINQVNRQIPPLINNRWIINKVENNEHYYYSIERLYKFCVSLEEAEIYLNQANFLSDAKVIRYILFKKKNITTDYINYYYQFKENALTPADKKIAKLKLNSLYGKFGQKSLKVIQIPKVIFNESLLPNKDNIIKKSLDSREKDYYNKFEYREYAEHSYLPLACAITSLSRSFLINSMLSLTSENKDLIIYYTDTDSIKVNRELKGNLIDPKKLGLWKFEGFFKFMKIIRSKVYYCVNDLNKWDNNDILASSGLNPEKLQAKYKPSQINGESNINALSHIYDLKHQPILIDSFKYINKQD